MSWLGDLLRRRQIESDLAAEIQAHLDEKVETLVEQGNRARARGWRRGANSAMSP